MRRSSPRTLSEGPVAVANVVQPVGLASSAEAANPVADRFAAVSTSPFQLNRLDPRDQPGIPYVLQLP